MRNEIVYGLSDAEYFASEGLSKHKLDDFAKAPLLYKHRLGKEFKPSRSMELGTLVHKQFLENETAFVVAPEVDRRTKVGKAIWDEFCQDNELAGLTVVTQEEASVVMGAVDSLNGLMDGAVEDTEVAMYWERDGVQCKGKVDAIVQPKGNGTVMLMDVKTTSDIMAFDRDFFKFRYDHQAAWYSYGYEKLTGKVPAFVFLVVEMNAPFLSQCVLVSGRTIDKANASIDSTLLNFKQCHATNHWPNLPHTRLI
jgi:hypothetical protein